MGASGSGVGVRERYQHRLERERALWLCVETEGGENTCEVSTRGEILNFQWECFLKCKFT